MGEGKRRCRRAPRDKGAGGVHKGNFHIPGGMVVRGGSRQPICQLALHMSQKSIFFLVKGTLTVTHLALCIIRGGAGRGGGEGWYGPRRG